MNKFFYEALVILLLLETAPLAGREAAIEPTMREASLVFLKAVIGDILRNPETAEYFPGVKPNGLILNQEDSGRLMRWEYRHGVHVFPDPGMQVTSKPVFESKTSIVFSIFVANEQHGHSLFPWVKSYKVLADSRLVAGFDLETGGTPGLSSPTGWPQAPRLHSLPSAR
jgi:hypothetical protein